MCIFTLIQYCYKYFDMILINLEEGDEDYEKNPLVHEFNHAQEDKIIDIENFGSFSFSDDEYTFV